MSAFAPSASADSKGPSEFEFQRSELVREIALSMESALQNINRLNRNLESIIAVGNEFGSVEALWSQFEHFMGPEDEQDGNHNGQEDEGEGNTQATEDDETMTENK
ncbi:uncharacterized protein TRUGW13939_05118 [Talaromyces rugulosus]|uniref:DASH complex subunit DAD1 n=1 Tax=Talaromyces rugulosus TaxID=121627 RepID=A0A7H8QWF3_TALRU|nr:uncharacterized protein TRUGW13939_05118 [Talaromyces rugulosus]QKX57998.1 hypothetical protein TRUGW13939_05118 [Talaromyces rugulosus]